MNNGQIAPTNELPAEVLHTIERIRSLPVPPDSLDRSLARAALLAAPQPTAEVRGSFATVNRASLCRWALWLGSPIGLAAAALLLIGMLLPTSPTLAQSLLATKAQPWLYGRVTYKVDGSEHKYEFWFAAEKRIFALKLKESSILVHFGESLQDNRVETYDPASGDVTTREDVELRQQDLDLLRVLLAGDAQSAFSESTAIESPRAAFDRYSVKLKDDNGEAEHVITVSRQSGLLHSWHVKQPSGATTMTQFAYPRSGPENIGALRDMNEPPASEKGDHSLRLEVIPTQGVGEIRFGSSIAEIRTAWGEAAKDTRLGPSVREMVYANLGLVLLVHNVHGVGAIHCCSNHARHGGVYGVTMTAFPGKTKEGIGIGSTREELFAAYGEPTSNNQDGSVGYANQHIGYEFIDGRISRFGMRARGSRCVSSENENQE